MQIGEQAVGAAGLEPATLRTNLNYRGDGISSKSLQHSSGLGRKETQRQF